MPSAHLQDEARVADQGMIMQVGARREQQDVWQQVIDRDAFTLGTHHPPWHVTDSEGAAHVLMAGAGL